MVNQYLHVLQGLRTKYEPKCVYRIEWRLREQMKKQINACRKTIKDFSPQNQLESRNLGETFAQELSRSAVKGSQSLGKFSIQTQLASSLFIALIAFNHVVSPEQVNVSVDDRNNIHVELLDKPMQKNDSGTTLITLSKRDVDDCLSKINQYLLALSSATVVPSRLVLGLMKKNKEMGLAGLGYAVAAPLYLFHLQTGLGVTALASIIETIGFEESFSSRKKQMGGLTSRKILLVIPDSFQYLKDKLTVAMPDASTGRKIPAISAQYNINLSQLIEAVRGGALIACPHSGVLINSLGLLQGLMEGVGMEKIADLLRQEAVSGGDSAVDQRRQARLLTKSALISAIGKTFLETSLGSVGLIFLNWAEALADNAVLGLLNSTKPE
jgi:hypothetical protein